MDGEREQDWDFGETKIGEKKTNLLFQEEIENIEKRRKRIRKILNWTAVVLVSILVPIVVILYCLNDDNVSYDILFTAFLIVLLIWCGSEIRVKMKSKETSPSLSENGKTIPV